MVCDCELAAGREAVWHRDLRKVTCLACSPAKAPAVSQPGASALREYERRHERREQHARETLGGLGVVLARVIDEPSSTKVWKQGGEGEARTASRLEKHLAETGVRLLHDRRIPGHGNANIDHVAIGPGGITVIDTKTHRGTVQVDRVGGLFVPRRTVLLINGRDRTRLIEGLPLLKQLVVRDVVIDGPKPVARLAARQGGNALDTVNRLYIELERLFPAA
jgi:nuclease-like protein